MAQEACRIIITQERKGLFNVSAPMKYKELCYDILKGAEFVIERTGAQHFFNPGRTLLITMDMTGTVDVAAPLPPLEWCLFALRSARQIIEQFDEGGPKSVPSGYADSISGP